MNIGTALNTNQPLLIGQGAVGVLDEVRLYNRRITNDEIKYLYWNPAGGGNRTVINGGQITTGLIKSKNYVPGVSGTIFDLELGEFETSNGTFRGTFSGVDKDDKSTVENSNVHSPTDGGSVEMRDGQIVFTDDAAFGAAVRSFIEQRLSGDMVIMPEGGLGVGTQDAEGYKLRVNGPVQFGDITIRDFKGNESSITYETRADWTLVHTHSLTMTTTKNRAAALTNTSLAFYCGEDGRLYHYLFNGTSWVQDGNILLELTGTTVTVSFITAISTTDIVMHIGINPGTGWERYLRRYSWDGTNWNEIGIQKFFPITLQEGCYLGNNKIVVATAESGQSTVSVYSVTDSGFTQIGIDSILPATNVAVRFDSLSDTDICYVQYNSINNGSEYFRTYRWNGNSFTQIGNTFSLTAKQISSVIAINRTDMLTVDDYSDYIRTYRWNGLSWTLIDASVASSDSFGKRLVALGMSSFIEIHPSTDTLKTYHSPSDIILL